MILKCRVPTIHSRKLFVDLQLTLFLYRQLRWNETFLIHTDISSKLHMMIRITGLYPAPMPGLRQEPVAPGWEAPSAVTY